MPCKVCGADNKRKGNKQNEETHDCGGGPCDGRFCECGAYKALETGAQAINMGNQATYTGNTANWSNVPEPTSGLLLHLGIAGLALRRRRA